MALSLAWAAPCLGEPVYLDCEVSSKSEQREFSVKLDEASGKITHTWKSGGAFNTEGFFAANTISYKKMSVSDLTVTRQYSIDRTTLEVVETFSVEVTDPELRERVPSEPPKIKRGSCSVVEVKDRKI